MTQYHYHYISLLTSILYKCMGIKSIDNNQEFNFHDKKYVLELKDVLP